MASRKKKDEAEKQAEAQAKQAELAEAPTTKEQAEALGAGRTKAKDRTERKSAKPDKGPGFESPTPSALALEKVGPDGDGEAYQAEKRKHRWGAD
jgi:hypothetical protein